MYKQSVKVFFKNARLLLNFCVLFNCQDVFIVVFIFTLVKTIGASFAIQQQITPSVQMQNKLNEKVQNVDNTFLLNKYSH